MNRMWTSVGGEGDSDEKGVGNESVGKTVMSGL